MSQTQCSRCIALKKDGAQCTRRTCKYSNMCWQHTKALKGLQIKPSGIPNAGLGLFTSKPFTNNQTIARFGGDIVPYEQYRENPSGYGIHINNRTILDSKSTQSGMARYANTCKTENRRDGDCVSNNSRIVVNPRNQTASLRATRRIPIGNEVFAAYGNRF